MVIVKGNIFDHVNHGDILVVPVNGTLFYNKSKSTHNLVMGAGAAKVVSDMSNALRAALGEAIIKVSKPHKSVISPQGVEFGISLFGFILTDAYIVNNGKRLRIGIIQTKEYWKERTSVGLLKYSLGEMAKTLNELKLSNQIHMFAPGIGYGNLNFNTMLDVVNSYELPNVTIYTL